MFIVSVDSSDMSNNCTHESGWEGGMTVKDLSMAAWPFWLKRLTVFLTSA